MRHEEIRAAILELVPRRPRASVRDLAAELGLPRGTVHYNLQALIREGRLSREACEGCGGPILETA